MIGIIDPSNQIDVAMLIKFGLVGQQHRGKHVCGVTVSQLGRNNDAIRERKSTGDVETVLGGQEYDELKKFNGNIGIGCVGHKQPSERHILPFAASTARRKAAIVFDGKIINAQELMISLSGHLFQTGSDAEVFLTKIKSIRDSNPSTEEAIIKAMRNIKGAYSAIVQTTNKLIAVRDPMGIKPLCMGKVDGAIVFASESCALDAIRGQFIRDVKPGEIIVATKDGVITHYTENCPAPEKGTAHCSFEHIYYANVSSIIDGYSVFDVRRTIGRKLGTLFNKPRVKGRCCCRCSKHRLGIRRRICGRNRYSVYKCNYVQSVLGKDVCARFRGTLDCRGT